MPTPITYLELPSTDVATDKHFYASLFGWTFQDFGPTTQPSPTPASKAASTEEATTNPKPPSPCC